MITPKLGIATLAAVGVWALLAVTGASTAIAEPGGAAQARLPAAAEATVGRVQVRKHPRRNARQIATMSRLRFDFRPTVFFVIGQLDTNRDGPWYLIRVPGRPNGQKGWVRSGSLRLREYVGSPEIVIDRSKRELRLVRNGRTILRKPVAVGAPGAPSPIGHFYLTAGFKPNDDFLGPWAFETSAYSAITDWPRGGIVGLHGTSEPSSVGHRSSHGCLRVKNDVIRRLKKRVGPGTPLRIKHYGARRSGLRGRVKENRRYL